MFGKLLFLDSTKSSNNVYKLDKRIEGTYKLVGFVTTNNMFNINNNNNKIYWNENGTDRTTTLTNGYYSADDFKTHLQTQMNADGSGTVSVTLNDNTRKLTINDTNGYYFTFATNTSNSARKLLGFNEADGTNANSQVSDNPIDLNTHKNIFISIEEDDHKNLEGITFFNASFVVNGVGAFGEICRYIDDDNFCQYIKFKQTKKLKIKFHDTSNNTIDLNSEYQLILQKV